MQRLDHSGQNYMQIIKNMITLHAKDEKKKKKKEFGSITAIIAINETFLFENAYSYTLWKKKFISNFR